MNRIVWLLAGLMSANAAFGQSCSLTDVTVGDLLQLQGNQADADKALTKAEEAKAASQAKLLEEITAAAVSGAESGGTILNFLPLLSLTGFSGNLEGDTDDNENDNLGFDFNIPLPFGPADSRQLKLAASFNRQPQVFEPLIESLAEDQRDSFREGFEDDLGLGDDATFSVSYNWNTETLGRHRGLVGNLFGEIITSVDASALQTAFFDLNAAMAGVPDDFGSNRDLKLSDVQFVDDSGNALAANQQSARQTTLCNAWKNFFEVNQQISKAEDFAVKDSNIDQIAKLASNQPQLHATVNFRERADVVGPDEVTAKVTFEWGYRANLNALGRFTNTNCPKGANGLRTPGCLIDAYSSYLANNKAAIDSSDRLSFSLEYADVDDYSYSAMDPMIDFQRAGSDKVIGSLGYGRLLDTGALEGSRLDLSIKYEDVSDDDTRNDRSIGVLTITKKFGEITVPFSIVYSNKPEFVEMESTSTLSAHLGIKYEFQAP